ncbi:MAG: hypothetical protein JO186_05255 [Actinobacteria bacterium]|nr:hypothetical protein [Actinomycetota bacterium]MBV8598641.1 hypothetical protein [Actinomycetota bacterium]
MFGARLLAASSLVAACTVPAALASPETTAPSVYVNIHVTLSDSKITVSPKTAPRGANARFIVRNIGTRSHDFTLSYGGGRGFTRAFAPGVQKILVLYLNVRGTMTYYGGSSAAASKPGMKGFFIVGDTCAACIQY